MITLAQAKVGMADKVDQNVIDTFRRSSLLLDKLEFDNSISPGTGGSTLVYGYMQTKTPSTAGIRKINEEYTPNEALREEKTTKAVIMGGSFKLDRVIIGTAGAVDELAYQTEEKVKATASEFHNMVVNGDTAKDGFDGLNKLLSGTESEVSSSADLSTATEENSQALLDELDLFLSGLSKTATMFLANKKLIAKIKSAARRAGYYERTKDDFGRTVEMYNGIILQDAGQYYDGSKLVDVIPVDANGKTDIYAFNIGRDALIGISPTGSKVIETHLPDLDAPGAVKEGDVELVAGIALKDTTTAGVLRGIKIK